MSPIESFPVHNKAETIFDRLEAHGLTWRVYCSPPARMPFTGIIHAARLQALARPLPHRRGAGLAFLARQLRPGGLGIA